MRHDAGMYIVLTMRGISLSKMRLAPALGVHQRAELNRWLLARTLRVVGEWLGGMDRCVFVTACQTALATAAAAGARVVDEPGGAGGHNHAAAVGASHAAALGARKVMMLPCDLPDLTCAALDAFAACLQDADFVLAPDLEGSGTNAVLVDAATDLEFYFGPGSRRRYTEWAEQRGWRVAVHSAPALAFDLDTPDDFAQWSSRLKPENALTMRGAR